MELPEFVLFDLNGTLTDPSAIGGPWGQKDLGLRVLDGAIRGGMTDALLGTSRPFSDHVSAALAGEVARRELDEARFDEALRAASALPAWPDAGAALEDLRGAGLRLAVLTNSGADAGRGTLESAGLLDLIDAVIGVDAVATFKPDPRTYAHAIAQLGVPAGAILMVAAHGWDIAGANAAGLRTAWIARGEGVLSPTVPEPDLRVADLSALARRVLGNTALQSEAPTARTPMRETIKSELAEATAELRAHMATWEYAFAMAGGCHGGRNHPVHSGRPSPAPSGSRPAAESSGPGWPSTSFSCAANRCPRYLPGSAPGGSSAGQNSGRCRNHAGVSASS